MGVLLGLAFGLGLLLIWSAFTTPVRSREPRGPGRLRALLDRAGLAGVAVRSLVLLTVLMGFVAALVIQVVSRTADARLSTASGHTSASSRCRRRARPASVANGR